MKYENFTYRKGLCDMMKYLKKRKSRKSTEIYMIIFEKREESLLASFELYYVQRFSSSHAFPSHRVNTDDVSAFVRSSKIIEDLQTWHTNISKTLPHFANRAFFFHPLTKSHENSHIISAERSLFFFFFNFHEETYIIGK